MGEDRIELQQVVGSSREGLREREISSDLVGCPAAEQISRLLLASTAAAAAAATILLGKRFCSIHPWTKVNGI